MEEYWYWLCGIEGMYRPAISKLMKHFLNPRNLFEADEGEIMEMKLCGDAVKESILRERRGKNPKDDYHERKSRGIEFISIENPHYPKRLRNIPDPPYGLFYMGALPREELFGVAMVGARRCSGYGRRTAMALARELTQNGIQVVSGMATGIDGYSQSAALDAGGVSFGVLGCGVDVCYPEQNRKLYERLREQGGVLSEYPPGSKPLPFHFPMRNRILSGLCDAVVVVEAREKSGSLITADCALDQGKDVYAVPGRVDEELSRGCNQLIAQGAAIVTKAQDLLRDFGITANVCAQNKKNITLETKEKLVYSCLDLNSKSLSQILLETGLPVWEATGALLSLELRGLIRETAKNFYEKAR